MNLLRMENWYGRRFGKIQLKHPCIIIFAMQTLQLNHIYMALTLTETMISNNQQFAEMLDDLQANILKHHGRSHAYHIFLSLKEGKEEAAKNWIAAFAVSKITSAAKQHVDSDNKHKFKIDGGTIYTLSLSSSGYDRL